MNDKKFKELALQKGEIVSAMRKGLSPGWYWLVTDESPKSMVIEFRKI